MGISVSNMNQILQHIADLKEFKIEEHKNMREVFDAKQTCIHTEMIAFNEAIMAKLEEIISHQKVANGRTSKVEAHVEQIENKIEKFRPTVEDIKRYQGFVVWVYNHPVKAIISVITTITFIVMLVEMIGSELLLEIVK